MLNRIFKILIFFSGCLVLAQETDRLPLRQFTLQTDTTRSQLYHFLWGKHYKKAFAEPIPAFDFSAETEEKTGFFFRGKQYKLESLAIDSLNYFKNFPDFNKLYKQEDFEGTFAQKMITDAYRVHYPFGFLIANEVAKNLQLSAFDLPYFYKDNKLYKGIPTNQNLISTDSLIALLQTDFTYKIDTE
ncbi:MAG: hypothetical protein WCY89_11505, partial [Flavobacteriaceae bacterium]